MITSENLIFHELVGLFARTFDSGPYSGLSGHIVKESRNMITLRSGEVLKSLPKSCINIRLTLPTCGCFISGNSLIGRPEDRVVRKNLG
ncbi:MAG: ribonuclease P protein subunit [Nitrososphaeraceae archaeon]